MERHVFTRHVREMLHFKPHVRYIANYHKCHVDRYVVMSVVEEDDAPSAAPMESSTQSSAYYSHSSSSSGYDADSPSTVSSPPHISSQQPLHSVSLPIGFADYHHAAHSTPSSARVRGDQSPSLSDMSEDEGFATPPHVLLMCLKTGGRPVHGFSLESSSSFLRTRSYRHEPYSALPYHHRHYLTPRQGVDGGYHERRPSQPSQPQDLWRPW